ncbi:MULTISPECIES: ABC transporter permease [Psychrobacter]|jgi:ABC-2 type transport system permease protein|uniref:ABC transporter permease n=1 Tax=Psychrobacter TaxID=497 RepID=UPI000C34B69D|nr:MULTISPECIES: ABC transporter permease [Psychrobacter]MBA6245361.1 ABC transporter permease [Psychrobacter sp. Urea-trap-18]MBA6286897.1 ABC transporter permease [Psychrobacter sp. Urea-trap-16]MBA6317921.1 ABC transporter permease [Psychrobacter sp. Urea-trap-20]MBA6335166.1 ABC transporter permease [Psychrobacter sp. Urea-trap-19]PKG60481.1 ABC transporter permease [Psychrobacter sp. Choline-3u-12]
MSAQLNNTHSKATSTITPASQSFWSSFTQTLKDVFGDKGVLLMLIIAPIIYGFFYPWPYSSEVVNHVPVGIIDHDNSNLSRTLVRYASASPYLDTERFINEQAAKEAIWSDQIAGYMVIPAGLEEQVQSGEQAHVSVLGNGGYFILNKNVQLGFSQAVGTVSAGIKVKKSIAKGAYASTAAQNTQAVPLRIMPLYNQTEGYGAYVVPAVSVIILQQTLLMATAMLIGTWYEQRRHSTSVRGWLGRIGALSSLSFIVGCFYYGWAFELHHYPRGQNMLGTLLFLALFCPTVATLGCVLGLWFRQRERSMQILIFISLPIFFLSGYPWPADQLPQVLQVIRWLVPTTPAINTSVQLNQMGASISQVAIGFYALAGLWLLYFVLLLFLRKRIPQRKAYL